MDRSTPDTISDHGTVVFVKPMNVWCCDLEHDLICGPLARKHMVDNLGGGIGRLPNEDELARMVELVEELPAAPPRGRGG